MATAQLVTESDLRQTGEGALTVALSGGLDSCVLLRALVELPAAHERGLRALHVHHGLHPDADAWTAHCEVVCAELGVALRTVRVDVDRDSGEGVEASARRARHAAFETALGDGEVLALAHHRDDQAETFLLRALRASGPDGLSAMRPWRSFGRGHLWRPLLDRSRAELLAYAQAHGLRWIDDPSNADAAFDRNFLRHRVLPLLGERWPHAGAAFARSAELCAEASNLLGDEDASALARVRTADARVLVRTALRALSATRRARVLRRWIEELGLPPLPAEGVARIETEVLSARDDAEPQFAWQDATIRAWRDLLHADWQREALPADWTREWDGKSPLVLPDGAQLELAGAVGFEWPLLAHPRRGGERITLPGRSHSHTLKHLLQDLGVPPWIREGLPLLSSKEGELLAAGDLAYSERFGDWLRHHNARLVWRHD